MFELTVVAILYACLEAFLWYSERKRSEQDYADYMANRITFDVSERNSEK